jgi:hypothetical protein
VSSANEYELCAKFPSDIRRKSGACGETPEFYLVICSGVALGSSRTAIAVRPGWIAIEKDDIWRNFPSRVWRLTEIFGHR